jgi:predicted phosphate transport protein (TIGR00153 family)
MTLLFRRTRALEAQIDELLDAISEGTLVFQQGIADYLQKDAERFEQRLKAIAVFESKADALRREIETRLYRESLIPDHRGDVLGLLENIDNVIDEAKKTLHQFAVERPEVPADLTGEFLDLAKAGVEAAQHLVSAVRAFFRDITAVPDHIHKVYFYEKEADRLADRLKRKIFTRDDLDLAHKIHLRYFCLHVETLSDRAEEVADRLAIYTIKRTL